MQMKLTKKEYEKVEDKYELIRVIEDLVSVQYYNNIMSNKNPFSSQNTKSKYMYTCMGFIPLQLCTYSPNKQFKNVFIFTI